MTVLAQDHINLPNHDARLARMLRPELRAAPRPLPRERSQIRSGVGRPPAAMAAPAAATTKAASAAADDHDAGPLEREDGDEIS